jgi:hypothetical protein
MVFLTVLGPAERAASDRGNSPFSTMWARTSARLFAVVPEVLDGLLLLGTQVVSVI